MAESEKQSTATAAAEQVRAIVEAAQRSSAELESAARADAERIRAKAARDADRAREVVGRLDERAGELERRLDELNEYVREAVTGLKQDLEGLRDAGRVTARPPEATEPELDDEVIAEAKTDAIGEPQPELEDAPEGARVLALKMALDGTPREQTARYLGENFELQDPDALLDEVYSRVGR